MEEDKRSDVMRMAELREILADTIRELKKKEITPSQANGTANLAGKLMSSYKLELEYRKLIGQAPDLDPIFGQPQLSSPDDQPVAPPPKKK